MANKKGTIYALAENGVVKYIGQTTDIKNRYAQHCSINQNRGQTTKQTWLRELLTQGKKPELIILAETDDLDAEEIRIIKEHRGQGIELVNTADGGRSMEHLHRAKKDMPWGNRWSPTQKILLQLKSNLRGKYAGDGIRTKRAIVRIEATLAEVERLKGKEGLYELNLALWEKHGNR